MKYESKYLYLLPFKESNYFKIGISSDSLKRIYDLYRYYNVNLGKAKIIKFDIPERNAETIEKELLNKFPIDGFVIENKKLSNEIRNIKYFRKALDYLKSERCYIMNFYDLIKAKMAFHNTAIMNDPRNKKPHYLDTVIEYNAKQVNELYADIIQLVDNFEIFIKYYSPYDFQVIAIGANKREYEEIQNIYRRNKLFANIYFTDIGHPKFKRIGCKNRTKFTDRAIKFSFDFSYLESINSFIKTNDIEYIAKLRDAFYDILDEIWQINNTVSNVKYIYHYAK